MTARSFTAPAGTATGQDVTNAITAHDAATDPHGDRAYTDTQTATRLPLAGGTVSGALTVSGRLTAGGWPLPMLAPRTQRPGWSAATIVTNFQSGHGWSASGNGLASSSVNDTADFIRGTQAAKVTTDGQGLTHTQGAFLQKLGGSAVDLTDKSIRLQIKIDDITHVSSLNFFAGTSSLANNFKWRFKVTTATSQLIQSGEWVTVVLSWADVNAAAGTFTIDANGQPSVTSGFTDLRVQVVDDGAGAVTAHLQTVEIISDVTAAFPNGVVSIVFDDSNSSSELGRPRMDTYGYRGTQYTIVDSLGTSGRLTLSQLRNLQDMCGWEIAGHAYTQAVHDNRLTAYTAAQADDELRNLRAWLVSNGFAGDSFAYPGGNFENTTDGVPVERLVSRYFSSGRTILSSLGVSTNVVTDTFPPPRPYRINAMSGISSLASAPYTAATLTAAGGPIDRCKRSGSWLILVFHKLVSGTATTTTEISQTDFNTVIDAVNTAGIPVRTVGDVMRTAS